jgi:ribosomal protein L22
MADEKEKQPKNTDDKPKPRTRAKASASKGEPKATPKTSGRAKPKKEEAAKPRARKPTAAKADGPKAESKPTPKSKPTAREGGKAAEGARATKRPARTRGAAKEESKPAAAPSRRPSREEPTRPVVRAQAKYVRSSARKARLVIDHVRGKSVADARALLRHSPRGVARDLERLLASAVANAENNHDLVGDDLYVKEIYADEGPTLRRFRPRALGRATRIRKRTSHLTVALSTKE